MHEMRQSMAVQHDGVARASGGKEEAKGVGQVQLAQSPGGCNEPLPLGREEGRDAPAVPEPASGAVPPRRRECRALSQVVIIMRILVLPVSSCAWPPLRGSGKRSPDSGVLSGLARVAPAGARVALGLTVHRPLDLGPAPRTGRGEGGAARPCRCVRGEDAPSRLCDITKRF